MNKAINLFNIIGFTSVNGGMNASGFSIVLHKDFAAAVAKTKRNEGGLLAVQMREILVETLGEANIDPFPILFSGESWLLQSLRIGRNCACFSAGNLNDNNFTRHIRYSPHNIDSPREAACLLAVWLQWFNGVIVLTDFELPLVV